MPEKKLDRRFVDGQASEPAVPMVLRAGPVTALFDGSGIRYVRYGEREIVRRIYYAVRDANWGTVPDRICKLRTDIQTDSFRIAFDVENRQGEIDYAWHGVIAGEASGRLVIEASGAAKSTFRKNRIGFCVLHPMECAGLAVEIRHDDGSKEKTTFPRFIADKNPFLNVTWMRHEVGEGASIELTFEGDVFETEDQRNWIDASFKTFCTPLSKQFPVEVHAGDQIFQQITIEIHGKTPPSIRSAVSHDAIALELSPDSIGALPRIGFALPHDVVRMRSEQVEFLRLLRPAHLRCEVRLSNGLQLQLARAAELARELDVDAALELVLFATPQDEHVIHKLAKLIERQKVAIARWIVFSETGWSTTRELALTARHAIRRHDPGAVVGGGTPANFRELNAKRPPIDALDFVVWSMTPQIHAFDNASMVETLAAQVATVESAREFGGGLPLVVGPIALKMQVNPYATGAWPPPTPVGELPPQVDVRQLSLFGAGWTLGSIKYLAECGVQVATYYEVAGWKGLMEREEGSPLPELFPSVASGVFPMYHVFADLAEVAGGQVVPIRSPQPLRVEALAIRSGERTRVMVANFSNKSELVTLATGAMSARIRMLDQSSVMEAMTSPETYRLRTESIPTEEGRLSANLPPFAIATVDF